MAAETAKCDPPNSKYEHGYITLFISTFTTLLAIINPLEALPIFL